MAERYADRTTLTDTELLALTLEQLDEDARLYNRAIGSFNTHLKNHRERRDLHGLPYRSPITAFPSFDEAREGERRLRHS